MCGFITMSNNNSIVNENQQNILTGAALML